LDRAVAYPARDKRLAGQHITGLLMTFNKLTVVSPVAALIVLPSAHADAQERVYLTDAPKFHS
jgi:hypothetical protein